MNFSKKLLLLATIILVSNNALSYPSCFAELQQKHKQDAHAIIDNGNYEYYGVFDGHGPHGEKASDYVAKNLHEGLFKLLGQSASTEEAIKLAFDSIDKYVKGSLLVDPNYHSRGTVGYDSGTTAVIALIDKKSKNLIVANVGDSRAVLSSKGKAIALSKDHKLSRPDEKSRIEKLGGVISGRRVPRISGLAMSRSIGDNACNLLNYQLVHFVISEPEFESHNIDEQDDFLILASDGIWDVISNDLAVEIVSNELKRTGNCNSAAQALVKQAVEAGSKDDITVVIVSFKELIPKQSEQKSQVEQKKSGESNWIRNSLYVAMGAALLYGAWNKQDFVRIQFDKLKRYFLK